VVVGDSLRVLFKTRVMNCTLCVCSMWFMADLNSALLM